MPYFLSSYSNRSGCLGEQEVLWKHMPMGSVFTALFLSSPKLQKPVDMPERKLIWFRNKQKMALKHTDQDRVSVNACIIHANEMWLYLFHRDKTSVTIEPMDGDFYNNNMNNTKPGVKRRAVDDLQSGISQVNVTFTCMQAVAGHIIDKLKFKFYTK